MTVEANKPTGEATGPPSDLVGLRGYQLVGYDDFVADLWHFIERAARDRVSVDIQMEDKPFVTLVLTAEYDKLVRLAAWAETARERGMA